MRIFFIFFPKNRSNIHPRAVIGQHGKPDTKGAMPGGPGIAGFNSPALPAQYAEAYMNNLNSVLIEGNMVRDPLFRSTQKGTSVCNFTIASNRFYKLDSNFEKETGFFDVEAWGKLADVCTSQGRKGRGVRVVGRLKQDRWTGNDGKSHVKVAIVAEHVEYRADFKKATDAASEAETLAEAAAPDGYNTEAELNEFAGLTLNNAEVEEFQAVAF